MSKGKIVVLEDDAFFRNLYAEILTNSGYDVTKTSNAKETMDVIEAGGVDILITDLVMPDVTGQDVLIRTKQFNAMIDVILITAHGSIESAIKALKSGAFDYLNKPINAEELTLTVDRCMDQKKLIRENHGLKNALKLFEVSRTITSCLDIDKLYALSLDALMQETMEAAGIFLVYGKSRNALDIKALRQIDHWGAEKFTKLFKDSIEKDVRNSTKVIIRKKPDLTGEAGRVLRDYESFVIAPLIINNIHSGFLILLSKRFPETFSPIEIENILFLTEQAALSFENADKYSEAKGLAMVDSLTELYNARYLEVALDREIKRSKRTSNPFTVLFMDLDYFKKVNDSHGHLVGSRVLVEVGKLLTRVVREVDSVIRYGGDEYTIILADTDHNIAMIVAERIRKKVEENVFLKNEGLNLKITVSIGLASFPMHAKDKDDLLEIADHAMYYGKETSRNTVYLAPISK